MLAHYLEPSNSTFYQNLILCVQNGSDHLPEEDGQNVTTFLENVQMDAAADGLTDSLPPLVLSCMKRLLTESFFTSPYLLPVWERISWSVAFALMLAVAAIGNCIVIWIVLAHRRMRSVTNYFLLNLALADLSMSVFNAVFNFMYVLESNWTFGEVYCTVNSFVSNLAVSSSVFSISAMSIDRYFAIVYPLSPRMSRKKAVMVVFFIWIAASLLAAPTLFFSDISTYLYPDGNLRMLCNLQWPDGQPGVSYSDNVYNTFILILNYVLPMICMFYTYMSIRAVLWGSQGIGVITDRQKESIKSKKRVVLMLVAVVAIFAICWLPYHAYFLYIYYNPQLNMKNYIQRVYLIIYWLAMANSMVNPIIYYTMNERFRTYFHYILCFCRKSHPDEPRGRTWTNKGRLVEFRKSFSSAHSSLRVTLNSSLQNGRKPILEMRNSAPPQIVHSTVVETKELFDSHSPDSDDV